MWGRKTNSVLRVLNIVCCCIALTGPIACKKKKANLAGDKPVKANDFVAAFKPLALPYSVADSTLTEAEDTLLISRNVLAQFLPEKILDAYISPKENKTIRPIGRFSKEGTTYLLAGMTGKGKQGLLVIVFDKNNRFLASKEFFNETEQKGYFYSLYINKEPTFIYGKEHNDPVGKQLLFTRTSWVYANENGFMVVVNDSNEGQLKSDRILNPVESLPGNRPLSGDYVKDNRNFISIRDGRDPNNYVFFIHFEKKEGTCIGELKGQLQVKDIQTAIYSTAGDPCTIDFQFNDETVSVKEKGSCGNRRGMDCIFNDEFAKVRTKDPKKKGPAAGPANHSR